MFQYSTFIMWVIGIIALIYNAQLVIKSKFISTCALIVNWINNINK